MKRSYLKRSHRPIRSHLEMVPVEWYEQRIVRIFLSTKAAVESGKEWSEVPYAKAVHDIRWFVYLHSNFRCESLLPDGSRCPKSVSWRDGDMHEVNSRGMTAFKRGEISIYNSIYVCRECHRRAHIKRKLHWSKAEIPVGVGGEL